MIPEDADKLKLEMKAVVKITRVDPNTGLRSERLVLCRDWDTLQRAMTPLPGSPDEVAALLGLAFEPHREDS